MAKKNFITVFMFLLFATTVVFAGDIPESIMEGKQKAFFIGEITAVNTGTYNIAPSTVMMGSIQQSEIKTKKFNNYYGANDKPKTGDFIVAVLLEDNKIDDTWVFKVTSKDYKTLKLVSEKYDMVVRYEQYINEGKYFEAQKKIDENKKGSINSTDVSVESKKVVKNNKVQSYSTHNQFVVILLIVVIGVVVFFIVRVKKRHDN